MDLLNRNKLMLLIRYLIIQSFFKLAIPFTEYMLEINLGHRDDKTDNETDRNNARW